MCLQIWTDQQSCFYPSNHAFHPPATWSYPTANQRARQQFPWWQDLFRESFWGPWTPVCLIMKDLLCEWDWWNRKIRIRDWRHSSCRNIKLPTRWFMSQCGVDSQMKLLLRYNEWVSKFINGLQYNIFGIPENLFLERYQIKMSRFCPRCNFLKKFPFYSVATVIQIFRQILVTLYFSYKHYAELDKHLNFSFMWTFKKSFTFFYLEHVIIFKPRILSYVFQFSVHLRFS